jgi:peptide-methionine (S)-S-oxide reductase
MSTESITLGGGCFWCLDAVYRRLRGVSEVVSGYAGGHVARPTYEAVCEGNTGHAEVVQVRFDPQVISLREILDVFFTTHDPTTLNRQGADVGTQYRSAIFYATPEQKAAAEAAIADFTARKVFPHPIVTQVAPLTVFYPAEDYHQGYYDQNAWQPYCQIVISPKVAKLRQHYVEMLK